MTQNEALFRYCLRLGDNALIHSYRLSEWCGRAPILEEDLALTNFALDMTGRAELLLDYAGNLAEEKRTCDELAYRRGERQYFNNLIVELPDQDYAYLISKLLFVSVYECSLYEGLQQSPDNILAAIAGKTIKEVKYHREHASDWMVRLGQGTEESHQRMQKAVESLWMYTDELFETDIVEDYLQRSGFIPDMQVVRVTWDETVAKILVNAGLTIPAVDYMQTGGRKGIHTEYLGHILSEMQFLQRAYPDATW